MIITKKICNLIAESETITSKWSKFKKDEPILYLSPDGNEAKFGEFRLTKNSTATAYLIEFEDFDLVKTGVFDKPQFEHIWHELKKHAKKLITKQLNEALGASKPIKEREAE